MHFSGSRILGGKLFSGSLLVPTYTQGEMFIFNMHWSELGRTVVQCSQTIWKGASREPVGNHRTYQEVIRRIVGNQEGTSRTDPVRIRIFSMYLSELGRKVVQCPKLSGREPVGNQ